MGYSGFPFCSKLRDPLTYPSTIAENSGIRAWGLGAASPLPPSSHCRAGETGSHNNRLQGAGLGSRSPGTWSPLCHCLSVPFGLLGLLDPELLMAPELYVSALRTSGFMGVTTTVLGLRDVIYVGVCSDTSKDKGRDSSSPQSLYTLHLPIIFLAPESCSQLHPVWLVTEGAAGRKQEGSQPILRRFAQLRRGRV